MMTIMLSVTASAEAQKKRRLKRPQPKSCVECHQETLQQASATVVHAPFEDPGSCESCHKRHGVVGTLILQQNEPDLCLECHTEQSEELAASHVHEGFSTSTCTTCHEPHASEHAALLTDPLVESCWTCHSEEDFSRDHVHDPVGDCLSCHAAHSSAEPGLLAGPASEICAECHATDTLAGDHGGWPIEGGSCLSCHEPHSADLPGLMRLFVHEVVTDCDICHQEADSAHPFDLAIEEPGVCTDCHAAQEDEMAHAVVHEAFASFSCTTCHEPHASGRPRPARLAAARALHRVP